jgi:hypothetical protein
MVEVSLALKEARSGARTGAISTQDPSGKVWILREDVFLTNTAGLLGRKQCDFP